MPTISGTITFDGAEAQASSHGLVNENVKAIASQTDTKLNVNIEFPSVENKGVYTVELFDATGSRVHKDHFKMGDTEFALNRLFQLQPVASEADEGLAAELDQFGRYIYYVSVDNFASGTIKLSANGKMSRSTAAIVDGVSKASYRADWTGNGAAEVIQPFTVNAAA